MFTGLVQHLARVDSVQETASGARLTIDASGWHHRPGPGESIAVDGCCLTIAEVNGARISFDAVHQTLRLTTLGRIRQGDLVHLEHAVTPQTLLGGHLVQGHIDGVATVIQVTADQGEHRLRVEPPMNLMPMIVDKGSVALDGVSLTVAELGRTWFEVALIPSTLERTHLGEAGIGTPLNIEADCVAKMVGRWLQARSDRPE